MAVIRIPSQITGFNIPTTLRVNSVNSSDFLDLISITYNTIIEPRARINPKNSKKSFVTGFPKNCSFSRGMVTMAAIDSSIGNDSISPIAILYFP
jgi:hypothetical protein